LVIETESGVFYFEMAFNGHRNVVAVALFCLEADYLSAVTTLLRSVTTLWRGIIS